MTRSIGGIVLLALLLPINAKASENYDTLAPPPINFEREFVRIDGKVYEITFKNNRLDIQEDPPWYREAIHNHIKRMYHQEPKLTKNDRFVSFHEPKFDYWYAFKTYAGVIFMCFFYGFALFSLIYVPWIFIEIISRLFLN